MGGAETRGSVHNRPRFKEVDSLASRFPTDSAEGFFRVFEPILIFAGQLLKHNGEIALIDEGMQIDWSDAQ
jgi:hypothetical protein